MSSSGWKSLSGFFFLFWNSFLQRLHFLNCCHTWRMAACIYPTISCFLVHIVVTLKFVLLDSSVIQGILNPLLIEIKVWWTNTSSLTEVRVTPTSYETEVSRINIVTKIKVLYRGKSGLRKSGDHTNYSVNIIYS